MNKAELLQSLDFARDKSLGRHSLQKDWSPPSFGSHRRAWVRELIIWLKDISTPEFSIPSFNLQPQASTSDLSTPDFSTPDFSTMNF